MLQIFKQASGQPGADGRHMLRHACGFKLVNDGIDTIAAGYLCHSKRADKADTFCQ